MFGHDTRRTAFTPGVSLLERIYHSTVRHVRQSHRSAVIGLLLNMIQTMLMVAIFYVMMVVLGLRSSAIRGDFLLYIMSGIFMFMTHTKTVQAVVGSEGPTSPMMKHGPMSTTIAIASASLATLYIQVLSMLVVLYLYHAAVTPVEIDQPVGAFAMLLLAWASGIGVGMVFLAIKPWFPNFTSLASNIYRRANMIASGKMFLANTLGASMLKMFDWNPLFHVIDQARGFVFINYNPRNSSIDYPLYVTLVLIVIGLMAEFYTRRHASLSWGAGR